jgi:hypothetical protein
LLLGGGRLFAVVTRFGFSFFFFQICGHAVRTVLAIPANDMSSPTLQK